MLELFPDGFEEVERDGRDRARRLHRRRRRGARLALLRRCAARPTSRTAGRTAGGRSTGRSSVGRLWVGPPWEQPPRDALAVVIDPGRAFGTGAHPTTQLCLQLLQDVEPGSLLDVGCGSGVLSIARRAARLRPGLRRRRRAGGGRGDARERARERRRVDVRLVGADDALPPASTAVANISLAAVDALAARVEARTLVDVRLPASDRPQLAGWAHVERRVLDGWAADVFRPRLKRQYDQRRGDVPRRLPRLQGLARRRARGARGAARGRPSPSATTVSRRRRGDQHLLRHERGAREEPQGGRASRANAPPRLPHRLRREPPGRVARGPPGRASRSSRSGARRPPRSSPATSARSAASRPTRGSTACARS